MNKGFALVREEPCQHGLQQFEGIVPYSGGHTYCVMALKGGGTYAEAAHQPGNVSAQIIVKTHSPHIPKSSALRDAI